MTAQPKFARDQLEAFWMPFTANRQFKKSPRMFVAAKDMHYTTSDGRQVLDGTAGLWCVNAGHCRPKITEAIQRIILSEGTALDIAHRVKMVRPDSVTLTLGKGQQLAATPQYNARRLQLPLRLGA